MPDRGALGRVGNTMALCHGCEVLIEQLKANYFLQKSKQNWVRRD